MHNSPIRRNLSTDLFRCLLTFYIAVFFQKIAFAESQNEALSAYKSSVFLIKSPNSNACASAFLTKEGLFVTNIHFTKSWCDGSKCLTPQIFTADPESKETVLVEGLLELSVKDLFESLDITTLMPRWSENRQKIGIFELVGTQETELRENERLFVLGYPNCDRLVTAEGKLVLKDQLTLTLDATGNYGSSGSPVISSSGALVGIVTQASSPWLAIKSRLLGSGFTLKALRTDILIHTLKEQNSMKPLAYVDSILIKHYEEAIQKQGCVWGIIPGLQLVSTIEGLKRDAERVGYTISRPLEDVHKHLVSCYEIITYVSVISFVLIVLVFIRKIKFR